MDAKVLLARFTIPTRCLMDWDRMSGDDRALSCKPVHNLAAPSADERASLTLKGLSDGEEPCGRLFQRPDGTLVASECPTEPEAGSGIRQFTVGSLMTAIAGCAAASGITKLWLISPEGSRHHQRPGSPCP